MAEDLAILKAEPIDREAFAPYGQLVACPGGGASREVNEGTAERWDDQVEYRSTRPSARLNVATFQSRPRALPFDVVTLERHPCSTQMFVPLHAARYVVIVADGVEQPGALRAFLMPGDVGVAYAPGVWHHTLLVLDAPASFVCLVSEDGGAADCEVHELPVSGQRRLIVA